MNISRLSSYASGLSAGMILISCGGGSSAPATPSSFTVGGNVSGLNTGASVTLKNNGADAIKVSSNGAFSFATPIAADSAYLVTVASQPVGQTCTVSAGAGAGSANVSTVSVVCAVATYTISGTVTGMNSGEQITLQNNGADPLVVTGNTTFTFKVPVAYAAGYTVTSGTDPMLQTCTVSGGSGTNVAADIANVSVSCTASQLILLHGFGAAPDAEAGYGNLLQAADGNFYGVTGTGGTSNAGAVFKITPSGTETVLHSFSGGADGTDPSGSKLIQGADGNFYGTTYTGGTNNKGVVFKLTPAGTETVIYTFGAGSDAASPSNAGLILGADGNFYGTSYSGGTHNDGTIYTITPGGAETVLYSFAGTDGANPDQALILAKDGNFYGTTTSGGNQGDGTLFSLTPGGTFTTLHSFGAAGDGKYPAYGYLLQASDGNFYGTTSYGGANNNGTVYKMTPAGVETVLTSFSSSGTGPYFSTSSLVQGNDGILYGTSFYGGVHDFGSIFGITLTGTVTTVYSFTGVSDGGYPYAGLTIGTDGHLYGVTYFASSNNFGSIFRF